jgi:hypothetical protein
VRKCITAVPMLCASCMKDCGTHYVYVLVYVDDLMFIDKKPQTFFDSLTTKRGFKLKGVGGDFFRDSDGTLAWGAQLYVEKMLINYKTMFGSKTKVHSTPFDEKDHQELDNNLGIKQYQSLIGALQWFATLGRFYIN